MPPQNRRTANKPDADALAAASAPAAPSRLTKAAKVDPVLGQAQQPPQQPTAAPPAARKAAHNLERTKVGFYVDKADSDRARAAFNNLPAGVRPRSYSDFLADAVMARVVDYEKQYNGGEPWPSLEPGTIPTGKPLGA